jgi:acyl-CoA dehydrogenase
VVALQERVMAFVREHVQPAETAFKAEMAAFRAAGNPWQNTQTMERLKDRPRPPACGTCSCPTARPAPG